MRAPRSGSVIVLLIAAIGCGHDRGADAPVSNVALVVPDIDAAAPTIRPPQRSDYLELPSALPPTGSASAANDELDGIDIDECRAFVMVVKRCLPESTYREIVKSFRNASREPSARDAMRDICKRMTENYAQAGMGLNCTPP